MHLLNGGVTVESVQQVFAVRCFTVYSGSHSGSHSDKNLSSSSECISTLSPILESYVFINMQSIHMFIYYMSFFHRKMDCS